MSWKEITIPSVIEAVEKVESKVLSLLEEQGSAEEELFSVRLALEEAVTNAIKHGNHFDRNKKVTVRFSSDSQTLTIQVEDEGDGFDPNDVPDPTAEENLERESGRGLLLMRHYMDNVQFNDRGNCVTLVKRFQ